MGAPDHPEDSRLVTVPDQEPSAWPSHYFALSHKWGEADFLMLEKCNLSDFSARLPVEQLRSTFRDAIEATRALGYEYIWIDSLCIIQDDKNDWQKESAVMHLVYRNAACVLAASEAETLQQGLLDAAKPTVKTSFTCPLELLGPPATEFTISFRPERFLARRIAKSPLLKRGWVVQERYLSRRTIYFGSPLILECRESLMCDGHPKEVRIQRPLVLQPKIWPSLLKEEENPYKHWTRAVALFSDCALTKHEDKLVAMSGIAKTLAPILGSQYIAGIWEDYLPQSLLWCLDKLSVPTEDANASYQEPGSRNLPYIGMSWIADFATDER